MIDLREEYKQALANRSEANGKEVWVKWNMIAEELEEEMLKQGFTAKMLKE